MSTLVTLEDYYDLIELPSGSHIPVPVFRKQFKKIDIKKIPMGIKLRDNKFFICPLCHDTNFYQDLCFDCYENYHYGSISSEDWRKEFDIVQQINKDYRNRKRNQKLELIGIILDNRLNELIYIRADRKKKAYIDKNGFIQV